MPSRAICRGCQERDGAPARDRWAAWRYPEHSSEHTDFTGRKFTLAMQSGTGLLSPGQEIDSFHVKKEITS